MNILLNDSSWYHSGCVQVTKVLSEVYDIDKKVETRLSKRPLNISPGDRVILNGEGTMHHRSGHGLQFLQHIKKAQELGCYTALVNSVWQDMPQGAADIVKYCDKIFVRDILSKEELEKQGVVAEVFPDVSYFSVPEIVEFEYSEYREGCYYRRRNPAKDCPKVNIMKEDWSTVVNKLRKTKAFITGRHHEIYAACVARCNFIPVAGNTWKNEAVALSAGVVLPKTIEEAASGDFDAEYEKLWNYLDSFSLGQLL